MSNVVSCLMWAFIPSIHLLAQTSNNNVNKVSEIVSEITSWKIFEGAVIVAVAYGGLWAIDKLIHWLSEKVPLKFRLRVKQSLPFWRAFLLVLAGVMLINLFLNLSASNVLAVTGTVAVALGFAFKDYASSLIAGIVALFESPYQVGDRVKIGDHYGEIISYGLRGILLKTPSDNIVMIPHNKIWTEAISNANKGSVEAQTIVDFYLAHAVDVERVTQILYQLAHTSKYTQLRLPILVVMEEQTWGTHFKLKCYPIDARDEFIFQTDLIKRAKQAFAQSGIPYP